MLSEHCVPLIFFRVFSHLVYTSSHTSHTRGFSAALPFLHTCGQTDRQFITVLLSCVFTLCLHEFTHIAHTRIFCGTPLSSHLRTDRQTIHHSASLVCFHTLLTLVHTHRTHEDFLQYWPTSHLNSQKKKTNNGVTISKPCARVATKPYSTFTNHGVG